MRTFVLISSLIFYANSCTSQSSPTPLQTTKTAVNAKKWRKWRNNLSWEFNNRILCNLQFDFEFGVLILL